MLSKYIKLSIVTVLLLSLGGCVMPSVLLKKPVKKENKTWVVKITKLYDNVGYSEGRVMYYPPEGDKFDRVEVSITNKLNKPQVFNLDKVYLLHGKKAASPALVDMNALIPISTNSKPELSPHEHISRALIYTFPEKLMPDGIFIKDLGYFNIPKQKK